MAAYAALVSLMNNLHQIQNHPRFSATLDKHQVESLGEKIDFFLDFVESRNSTSKEETQKLEGEIASAAHEAEDVIESHIVDQILHGSTEIVPDLVNLRRRCLFGLQKVILDMNSITNKVLEVKEANKFNYQNPTNSMPAASPTPLSTGKSIMVGFDDELMQLKDVLIEQRSSRRIISIVGMGGAGKTTLARNVFEDSLTMHHFDLHAWATISQEYNVKDILLQLLFCFQGETSETVEELGDRLYKKLFGRRYLITLDDMWSIEVWDNIKFFFPDNGNGSRVVITTRLLNMASQLCSICIRINFLDEDKSWNLFCQKIFGQEDCPVELEGIGKKIVEQCKGLPLTIVVIGGLLRNSPRAEEYWQKVAQDLNSVLSSRENGECLDVLYLSYSHLPTHLKPCFLYMGTFKEDSEIRVSEMIRLWVAEGFLKPIGVRILEEIAEDYLKDLIDRNLILICAHRPNGKIRSCRIHDLLRELCISVANKEKFFCVVKAHSIPQGIDGERRLIFHDQASSYHNNEALESASLARSLIGNWVEVPVKCKLLRVLSKALDHWREIEIQNVNLRYFDSLVESKLPSSIALIWNVQTLIIGRGYQVISAPLEIWKMPQLRHLKCYRLLLPEPPLSEDEDNSFVLRNLQTLTTVVNSRLSEEACKRIPNIKKLRLMYGDMWKGYHDRMYDTLQNLGSLHKLESLDICCSWTAQISTHELKTAFPSSLNKLALRGCLLHWEDLSIIVGSLPQLEVLKLVGNFTELCKWTCVEGGFLRLKFLSIHGYDLISSTVDYASCFPVLEKLVLIDLWGLNQIPSGIEEMATLQLIRLENCTPSVAILAMKIKEEQESFGNYGLLIQARMPADDVMWLRERVEIEGLSINNIHLELHWSRSKRRWMVIYSAFRFLFALKRIVGRG